MNDELLTIKQFADAASVTQQSIYRRLADVLSPYVIMQGGRKLLKSEALDVYKQYLSEHGINTSSTHDIQHELNTLTQENTALKEQLQKLEHNYNMQQHVNTSMQKEIELMAAQNTQLQTIIETLTDENKTKNNQITELQNALKAAQTIVAMQMKQIEDRQRKEPELKQGFFARLFKKS